MKTSSNHSAKPCEGGGK